MTVALPGEALSVKVPAGVTTRVTPALCDRLPLVPVMVSGYEPAGVVAMVETESVVLFPVDGLKLPCAPAGNPVAFHVIAPVKLLIGVAVTAYDVDPAWTTDWLAGVAATEKSGPDGQPDSLNDPMRVCQLNDELVE